MSSLVKAAEGVRREYRKEHADAAAKIERKCRAVARRIAAGQTQLIPYHATLERQLRVLTADADLPPADAERDGHDRVAAA